MGKRKDHQCKYPSKTRKRSQKAKAIQLYHTIKKAAKQEAEKIVQGTPKIEDGIVNEEIFTDTTLLSIIKVEENELEINQPHSTSSAATTNIREPGVKVEYAEDAQETSFIMKSSETHREADDSVTPENRFESVMHNVNPLIQVNPSDPDILFCLSLHPSLKKIPEKYRNKAKIDILQVIDKYETMQ